MTISRLDLKVSEICIALGSGSKDQDLIGDMLLEGYPRQVINKIMQDAHSMLNEMEQDQKQEAGSIRIQKMIQEVLDEARTTS